MQIHDCIVKELYDLKSIAACIYLIERGRELEFSYKNVDCFISSDRAEKNYSLWYEEKEQSFDSMEELMFGAVIGSKTLYQIWEEITLGVLY